MTVVKCPECGNQVSTEARACPHCGAPVKKGPRRSVIYGGALLALVVLGLLVATWLNIQLPKEAVGTNDTNVTEAHHSDQTPAPEPPLQEAQEEEELEVQTQEDAPSMHNFLDLEGKTKAQVAKICRKDGGEWNATASICAFVDQPDTANVMIIWNEKGTVGQHIMRWESALVAPRLIANARRTMGQEDLWQQNNGCDEYYWDYSGFLTGIMACPGYSAMMTSRK